MPVVHNPYSEYGKEVRKWEQHHTQFSVSAEDGEEGQSKPGNPYVYRPYPKMLYRAVLRQGKHQCLAQTPDPAYYATDKEFERALLDADRLNRECQRIVKSEDEQRIAENDGWRQSPAEAMAALKIEESQIATAAAEVEYAVSKMGEGARRELAEAHQGSARHVTDIAGGSKKRGREPKAVAPEGREAVQA